MRAALLASLLLAGCGDVGPASGPCEPMRGTWRLVYVETDGNCGPVNDEIFSAGSTSDSKCTTHSSSTSVDGCRADSDFTCPTLDGAGAQRWTGYLEIDSQTQASGVFAAQVTHASGACRSTYDVTATKL